MAEEMAAMKFTVSVSQYRSVFSPWIKPLTGFMILEEHLRGDLLRQLAGGPDFKRNVSDCMI